MISVTNLLTKDTVFPALTVHDKKEALDALIASLGIDKNQRQAVNDAIYEREKLVSTGVGQGIAIPHCKIEPLNKDYGAVAILDEAIPFSSIDEEPVEYIFMLASPKDNDRKHLKILSKISRILNNKKFRSTLKQLKSSETVLEAFNQQETKHYS